MADAPHEHLAPGEVVDFSLGLLPAESQARFEQHLADCPRCQAIVAEALKASIGAPPGEVAPEPVRVGRFIVLRCAGAGAMGLVFEAYDPQLDRRVALKLRRGVDTPRERERVLQEARLMARLTHPNIVTVHEVGEADEAVFLVMELVDGVTLADWAASHRGAPDEVRAAYCQAGRGLAAAHRSGIIHRDFKPANVLVDRGGHVRVTDFGLAVPVSTLGLAGTPAYLAPEVLAGSAATAASDQFSFCVALYEALAGRRPWEGERERVRAAAPPRLPTAVAPARVRRAIARGLAIDPAQRHPSMDALLVEVDRSPRGARLAAGTLGAAALLAFGSLGYTALEARRRQCAGGQEELRGTWSSAQRAKLEQLPQPGAARAALDALDDWGARWVAQHRDSCEATVVRKEASAQVLDARMRCLGGLRDELEAAVAVIGAHPEAAAKVAGNLLPPESCRAAASNGAWPAPSLDAARLARLAHAVAELAVLRQAALHVDAQARVALVQELAREGGAPELEARALYEGALLARFMGRVDEVDAELLEVLRRAVRAGDDGLAVQAALARARTLGAFSGRGPEALAQIEIARGLVERLPQHHRLVAGFHWVYGEALTNANRFDEAEQAFSAGLKSSSSPGAEEFRAPLEYALANVYFSSGRWAPAVEHSRSALTIMEQRHGLTAPILSLYRVGLANALLHLGGPSDEAHAQIRKAADLLAGTRQSDAPSLWAALINSQVLEAHSDGAFDQAYALSLRSGEAYRAGFPMRAAQTWVEAAWHAVLAGKLDDAAEALTESGRHPAPPPVAAWRATVTARRARLVGDTRGAAKALEGLDLSKLEPFERPLARAELVEAALAAANAEAASEQCAAGLADQERTPMSEQDIAPLRFACARALASSEPERARALLDAARASFTSGKQPAAERARFEAYSAGLR